ncbi:prohibitin family protein [Chondrinema litorale]|uniref:prohibitin family protein n=1 Tax=Chondrinema litorale TaxID=2994555 RepID=UPI0025438D96|nr:prohibitin family protein [Chondrinema litorale]UZR93909.1 prohibitin family protein [Chondrinema litorale]
MEPKLNLNKKMPSFPKKFFGNTFGKITAISSAVLIVFLLFSTFYIVNPGNVGVITKFGAVQGDILSEGIHLINPVSTKIIPINVRVQKIEADATASSKDLQNVTSKVALNFFLSKEKANTIFQELGLDYRVTIIEPAIQESIKSATAAYTAEELITKRPDVKQDVFASIKDRLEKNNIIVTDFSIIDFNFTEEFNKAIEKKQIAEQLALTAKNDLNRIQTEAQQALAKAEGEANANLAIAKAQAESQRLLKESVNNDILELQAIEKWDGTLPMVIGEGNGNAFFDIVGAMNKNKAK